MATKKNREGKKKPRSADDIFADVEGDIESIEESEAVRESGKLSSRLEKVERKLSKMEMLVDITRALNSTLNLNELLEQIIDSVIRLAETERGFLMLTNDEEKFEFTIARDRESRSLEEKDFSISRSIVKEAIKKGEPLFISNALEDRRFKEQKSVLNLQLRTAICVPLLHGEKAIGIIYTDSRSLTTELSNEDMSIISAFASQASIAIENARLHGELVLSKENLARENLELKQELSERYNFSGIIGKSKVMLEIFDTIKKIAPYSTTVLIQGETGTGKELIARAIHFNGPRRDKQLVTINCGAMPAELLESELFGHKRGSFTGATSDKAGLFEVASGGTIFLDEIGEMPQPLQVKLLRALQEQEIRRVGENKPRKVDVRVIAATNRDLIEDVKNKSFRRDLYYRLNVVPINIPPLRERSEDIIPLTEHFLEKYAKKMHKRGIKISSSAMQLLVASPWPGNVRELENSIERALALCGDSKVLKPEHFPHLQHSLGILDGLDESKSLKEKLKVVEKQIIIDALERTGGKITRAAELLDVTRQHLHNKIKEYGISS